MEKYGDQNDADIEATVKKWKDCRRADEAVVSHERNCSCKLNAGDRR